jgi:hypothetical protein
MCHHSCTTQVWQMGREGKVVSERRRGHRATCAATLAMMQEGTGAEKRKPTRREEQGIHQRAANMKWQLESGSQRMCTRSSIAPTQHNIKPVSFCSPCLQPTASSCCPSQCCAGYQIVRAACRSYCWSQPEPAHLCLFSAGGCSCRHRRPQRSCWEKMGRKYMSDACMCCAASAQQLKPAPHMCVPASYTSATWSN